jgi:hypothetical protein
MTEVGLSLFTLRQLRLFSGSLVTSPLPPSAIRSLLKGCWLPGRFQVVLGAEDTKRERLAHVYALPSDREWADERLYLSPVLAHNLGVAPGASVTVREQLAGWTDVRVNTAPPHPQLTRPF